MTLIRLLAALAGASVAGGILLIIAGARRRPIGPPSSRLWTTWRQRARIGDPRRPRTARGETWRRWRWPVALTIGAAAWLITRWPVAAPIAAAAVIGVPVLLSASRDSAAAIDRVEAVEAWTRRLSDVLVVGVGLDQAITSTLRTCPDLIRVEVAALSARLAARWSTESALRAFADDLDDATGDLVVAALILGSRRRGPGLARVLAAVADSVADDVAMRRKIEAERAKPRTTARAVTLITVAVLAIGMWNGTYLRPYGTALGQLVLLALAAAFVGALAWMRALTLTPAAPRLLGPTRPGRRP